jgi:5'(3')-deoxyribonucleotidase
MVYRKKCIGVDIDGVLANQIDKVLPIIKYKHKIDLKYEDVNKWDLKIGDTDIEKIIMEEQKKKQYVLSMPAISGSQEGLNKLINKYKIAIVTSRTPESDCWNQKWLKTNNMPYDFYFNSKEGNKHNIDIDYDLLIDDYLGNIEKYLENSDGKAIIFSQPWNQNREHLKQYLEQGRLVIANNWKDVCLKVSQTMDSI